MRQMKRMGWGLVLVGLLSVACDDDESGADSGSDTDLGQDAAVDVLDDSGEDSGVDLTADAATDAVTDTATDAISDAVADAAPDATDAESDAAADAGSDTTTDSGADADAGVDAGAVVTVIGEAGGTASGPDGVEMVIPANAVPEDVSFAIARSAVPDEAIPPGVEVLSPVYEATPHGVTFASAVSVYLPWEGSPAARLYWETPDGSFEATDRCLSERGDELCGQTDHLSLFFIGGQRNAGFCSDCGGNECTAAHGTADVACAYPIDEVGGTANGLCMHVEDGTGASCGTFCIPQTTCFAQETCGNQVDDDCNGTVDDGCGTACTDDSVCATGEICESGYCQACSGMATECSAAHGTTDAACAIVTEVGTVNGVCLHRLDGAGSACGTICGGETTCAAFEICGNHIDDDCNGTVDDGCGVVCAVDAHCAAGEICEQGFCQACSSFPTECTAANGTTDAACAFTTEVGTTNGVCYQRVDSLGGACGSTCDSQVTCRASEQCGNHIDDDCNGTVDDGCSTCALPADCAAGEQCRFL